MSDLTNLAAEKDADATGTVVVIRDRNGDPYPGVDADHPATMTVLGEYAEPVQRAIAGNKKRLIKRLRTNPSEIDLSDEATVNMAVAAITAWDGWTENGIPAPCTPENIRRVLKIEWILRQVVAVVDNPKLFSKSGSAS